MSKNKKDSSCDDKHDHGTTSFLQNFDYFAMPVAMTYNGNKAHPTNYGGFITIWFFSFLMIFLLTRFWVLYYKEGDEFFQSKMNHDP